MKSVVPVEFIENIILLIRRQKVMLSMDLAELYGVEHRGVAGSNPINFDGVIV